MDYFNFVIVGSGPAGVAAARRLEGRGTCIVDIGLEPEQTFPYVSLRAGLEAGDTSAMLGAHWEMLANLVNPLKAHAKLRAAGIRHVACGREFTVHDATGEVCLHGAGSHAAGGMSNAWGTQLLRYTDADLAEAGNWPFKASALEPHYADLERHIGIAGAADDMHEFLGETTHLLPPPPLAPAAEFLFNRYKLNRTAHRLRLGRSRLAVLTRPYRGYPAYGFNETEFFSTGQQSLYTAHRTLDELRTTGHITYLGGHELIAYRESQEFVDIELRDSNSNAMRTLRTKHLLLGCGTLQSARLVLLNNGAVDRQLPFIDHPPTLVPLFIPRMFGTSLPTRSFPVQLVGTLNDYDRRDMISFYYPGALLWSDLLPDIPLPMNSALKILPNLLGGMLVAQIWETSRPELQNRLSLDASGSIRIDYPIRSSYPRLKNLLAALRPLGAYSIPHLANMAPPGWGFHHAACLPMRHRPEEFETHHDGRLWNSLRVRVVDGSVLPSLPAKNHSLTLMANAARIAEITLQCGY